MADNGRVSGLARFAAARAGWVVLAWVALAAALNVFVPQLEVVAARDSSAVVPKDAPSIVAVAEMDEAFGNGGSHSFVVIAMERDGGLVPADKRYAGRLAEVLTKDDENVSFVQDIRKHPELLTALTSQDGEARYLLVGITGQTGAPSSIRQVTAVRDVVDDLAPDGLTTAVTGPDRDDHRPGDRDRAQRRPDHDRQHRPDRAAAVADLPFVRRDGARARHRRASASDWLER